MGGGRWKWGVIETQTNTQSGSRAFLSSYSNFSQVKQHGLNSACPFARRPPLQGVKASHTIYNVTSLYIGCQAWDTCYSEVPGLGGVWEAGGWGTASIPSGSAFFGMTSQSWGTIAHGQQKEKEMAQ